MTHVDDAGAEVRPPRRRMILGTVVFVIGQLLMLGTPLIDALGLPDPWPGVLKVAMLIVLPDLALVAAIAIWGKSGYQFIKARVFGFLKRGLPPDRVGPVRYAIGLVMFCVPVVFGWAAPYISAVSGAEVSRVPYAVIGDLMFFASFFVLGGDFWDKIRSLFVRDAVAKFPS